YIPDIFGIRLLNHSLTEFNGLPLINLQASPLDGYNKSIKRCADLILSSIIVILISPLMILIAVVIKWTSPGPIIYRQTRIGLNNKPFKIMKFRTMKVGAEKSTGAVWATAGENRATRFGSFLRKTSLDELPQFINVLKGNMSIVGPRPERPKFTKLFKDEISYYMKKHFVKAGITGWAQVNGWRGSTDLNKRIEYDLYYIQHWSLLFDIKIILMTICRICKDKNAY
ncbi:MAG: exopolysaccharide biosynthesis polyprenyl glycosylphosphotransferase, partial [Lentisphaerota bacterium]